MPDLVAQSILSNEKRKARARAVLNKPASALPTMLVSIALSGICIYFMNSARIEVPLVVQVLVVAGFVGSIVTALDCLSLRRRLDAAIELIRLQQE